MRSYSNNNVYNLLKNSIKKDIFSHFYIFFGPNNVGKKRMALDFSNLLLCDSLIEEEPCNNCENCKKISTDNHFDIQIIDHNTPIDGSKDSKSDQIRIGHIHEIIRVANLGPFMSKYKIFIVNHAENLNIEASNAFLKLLEEPPPSSIFIFIVNDISLLYPTIVSRAQRIRLSEASEEEMSNYLNEYFTLDKPTENKIIQLSSGKIKLAESLAKNISLLDDYEESYNRFFDYCNSELSERLNISKKLSSRFSTDRNIIYNELSLWADFCKIVIKRNYNKSYDLGYENKLESIFSVNQINKIILILLKTISNLRENANSRLAFDVMGLNIPGKNEKIL
jgi:DNA polymerase-3 subunit delta'|tara:strand:- start:10979 stop:11989 length:1011 start_codon:yes stop_codon:yes gene_type:complete